jgi:hypothetical protein
MILMKSVADMKIIPRDCAVWLIRSVTSTYPNLIARKDNPTMKPYIRYFLAPILFSLLKFRVMRLLLYQFFLLARLLNRYLYLGQGLF